MSRRRWALYAYERKPCPNESHQESVVDEVTDKVVNRSGTTADEAEVRPMAEEAVDDLIDQPVQTFTPLLAENLVLTGLHAADPEDEDGD